MNIQLYISTRNMPLPIAMEQIENGSHGCSARVVNMPTFLNNIRFSLNSYIHKSYCYAICCIFFPFRFDNNDAFEPFKCGSKIM